MEGIYERVGRLYGLVEGLQLGGGVVSEGVSEMVGEMSGYAALTRPTGRVLRRSHVNVG